MFYVPAKYRATKIKERLKSCNNFGAEKTFISKQRAPSCVVGLLPNPSKLPQQHRKIHACVSKPLCEVILGSFRNFPGDHFRRISLDRLQALDHRHPPHC